jgi:hypothetical protein
VSVSASFEEKDRECFYLLFTELITKGDIDLSLLIYHPNHPLQTGEES